MKLRTLSLLTILLGAAALAPSTRAQDNDQPPPDGNPPVEEEESAPKYCCTVQVPLGFDWQCCGKNGCRVVQQSCASW